MTSRREKSETGDALAIAIAALSYIATQPKIMERFFTLTGLQAHTIKEAAGTPGFVTGVLDFVMSDETLLLAVAAEQEIAPEVIVKTRRRLDNPLEDEDWPPRPADDWA